MTTLLKKHSKKFKSFFAVGAFLVFGSLSSNSYALSPFNATYQFSYNGKNMGTATRSLSQNGNQWVYSFSAKAAAIASANETSRFSLNNGKITSSSFSRSSKILVHNNTLNIQFNPTAKTINTKKDSKSRSFAWRDGVLDELNAELQVREDLKGSGLKGTYYIADAKSVDARQFVNQGKENIKTPYGTFETIKVLLKHNKADKNSVFWLAPQLDYLPVKMSHQDGKTSYSLLLTSYKK
ncbi:DUF3108 domain-containing protein [Acinetobacter larvae]|uniref:DUF3108 domain-containing protein n=1 Tax=Acinetobacter larvae TaxID=1789224 RepID=A0A1B2M4A1_9GAMM|nr:DUF3108 domain-containing protein [Acinetobacter larvae]AOA60018.1 hypothetical protein BFG52_14250 [Acinetobacter larvae]